MHGDETHELPISMVSTFVTASLSIGALQEGSVRTESISSGPPPTASRPQNILQEISMVLYDGFYPLISLGAQSFAQSSTIVFGSLPSKAISWMRVNSGNSASSFLCLSTVITSLDVMVPWSFWPLSLDFSISSHEPSPLAKASAHARLRPDQMNGRRHQMQAPPPLFTPPLMHGQKTHLRNRWLRGRQARSSP